MTTPQINFINNDKQLIISVRKSPIFVRIILMFILILFTTGPILGLISMVIEGGRIQFGHFISLALFWGLAYYVFRVFCWNTFGKEYISFSDKVKYYSDFKFFKDSYKEFNNSNLSFEIEQIGYEENNEGVLIIRNNNETIKSVIKIKIPELKKSIERLKNYTKHHA